MKAAAYLVRLVALATAISALGACSINEYLDERSRIDYKSAGAKRPPLDIPPDLASPRGDGRFAIPDSAQAERTASGYERSRAAAQPARTATVLPATAGVRMERQGGDRWLVTELPPEQAWILLREFWQESGFIIQTESPETGILETDWAENRAKIPLDFIRRTLGKAVDQLYSTGERDKFRTRIEKGQGGTEIYVSHRGMVEVYSTAEQDQTIWQPRPSDPELEIEFMRRMMVKLGATQERAEQATAAAAAPAPARARLFAEGEQPRVEIAESFDRAWRSIGLALDRGGFTVDDRDRSRGLYFVRYIDPEAQARQANTRPGFFSRLIGRAKEEPISQQFQVRAVDSGSATVVTVLDREGKPVAGIDRTTATKILTLLHEQLK
ncbi:outer membrane protein assembly factor BamC [Burkholderiaceae bacterium FT117]|uniref:outer membrane protein assembly factor BamC n=1 Tax=Zeimonas sediminis TaxID=2944268 RepID=UPI002342DA0E|nr:outer membrane protein assembly factor BamC [Zeimonas sediminis]MCM5569500.1 outer membrane protein assembly factor BamC [Zeimonas sediminis]